MSKIIDKIKKKIYQEARKIYLKKSICNIGEIVEEADKIICYVNKKNLNQYRGNNLRYKLKLNGMNLVNEETKEVVEKFRLNKPVYYIFDGINFSQAVEITSLWSNVIFKNCTFDKNIGIVYGNNITFENNKYEDHCSIYHYGKCFLTADRINKLTFINDDFINSSLFKKNGDPIFGMQINAKEVEFIDTKVDTENTAQIVIKAEKIKIKNSNINSNEIYLDAQSIDCENSLLISEKGIMIDNEDCDFDGNIKTPLLIYNGTNLINQTEKIININQQKILLKKARNILIDKLKKISNYCHQINNNKIQIIQNNLNNQTVAKMLKKR